MLLFLLEYYMVHIVESTLLVSGKGKEYLGPLDWGGKILIVGRTNTNILRNQK